MTDPSDLNFLVSGSGDKVEKMTYPALRKILPGRLGPTGPTGSGPVGPTGPAGVNDISKVYNSLSMNKGNSVTPDVFLDNTWSGGVSASIPTWEMGVTGAYVQLPFKWPSEFDPNEPVSVDLHYFVTDYTGATGDTVRFEVLTDAIAANENVDAPKSFPASDVSTNVTVDPNVPSGSLVHYRTNISMSNASSVMVADDWIYMLFGRTSPTGGAEYTGSVYLSVVELKNILS